MVINFKLFHSFSLFFFISFTFFTFLPFFFTISHYFLHFLSFTLLHFLCLFLLSFPLFLFHYFSLFFFTIIVKEVEENKAKVQLMKDEGKDIYDIKKQVNFILSFFFFLNDFIYLFEGRSSCRVSYDDT